MTAARFAIALLLLGALTGGGCGFIGGLFGGDDDAPPPAPTAEQEAPQAPAGPFAGGVLNVIAQQAPPGSVSQFLARLAADFGWEAQVGENALLKEAVLAEAYAQRVQPHLLGLYYRNGFSVLPMVGEGHQFNRDTVVRGAVGSARLLVTTREPVRVIFLAPVENVQIVHHQDGEPPQVFSVSEQAVVAVRESLHKYYLR